jgi:hypothetical protein
MDTTLHTARTRLGFVRTHTPTQPQSTVSCQPPKLHGLSPAAAAPPLLAMPATAPGNRAASAPTLRSTDAGAAEQQNERSAALVELVGRVLIEKLFFQHLHIPQDVLLSLMNNVIQTVAPEQKKKIDLFQESAILYKQFQGKALTPEEQRYEDALKEIDVPNEILNGIKYSAIALMGNNLCTSISSAINQGLWSHVPAIMGYTGAIAFGPKLIQGAVEKALAYSGLTAEQKKLLTPWLNTIGRLALGFMPKVSANEQGVHYRHPSVDGHTRIVTPQGMVTLAGEQMAAHDGMQFKLHGIREITQDRITLTVMNEAGKKIAVEFTAIQHGLDKGIAVKSSDKNLEGYWNQEIRSVLPAMQTKDLTCQSALVVGVVASTVGQNALPALIATLSCWPQVSAFGEIENELGASTSKRAVMQQQFPAIFDLNSLDGANGFVVPGVVASGLLGFSVSTAGDINGDGITDLVLGASNANANLGASYVIFGNRNPFPASFNITQLNGTNGFTIPGVANGQLGNLVSSAGDINGDNITDLMLVALRKYKSGRQLCNLW